MNDSETKDLIDYWRVVFKYKKAVLIIVSVFTFMTMIYSFSLTDIYEAKSVVFSTGGQSNNVAAVVNQIGLGGLLGNMGGASDTNQLLIILRSRALARQIVKKYGLLRIFNKSLWDETHQTWKEMAPNKQPKIDDGINQLLGMTNFNISSSGLTIEIQVNSKNPKFAAEIANIYAKELGNYINESVLSSAKKNRIFIEQQLQRSRASFLEAGKALIAFYTTNKISNTTPTINVDISIPKDKEKIDLVSQQLDQIPFLEESLQGVSTRDNFHDKSVDLGEKIKSFEFELKKIEVVQDVPQQVYLQYLMLRRELLGQINTLLSQQYEMAKISESKENINFQVLDWAYVPLTKARPLRKQMVIMGTLIGCLFGILYAFIKNYFDKKNEI